MPKMLDLFAGTRCVSKEFEKAGWETYSVDWDRKFENISLYADISKLTAGDIIKLCGGKPDVVWLSPDCSSYSISAIFHHRQKVGDTLVPKSDYAKFCDSTNEHVMQLLEELRPKYFFIENPRAGMRKMDFITQRERSGFMKRYTVTYCFAGETEIVTKEGIREIKDIVNQDVKVLTPIGWDDAHIYSFGVQKLMKIILSRSKKEKIIYATADHKWILKNESIVTTSNLKKNQKLAYCKLPYKSLSIIPEFVARGFAFGDGHILSTQPKKKGFVMFCGEKQEMMSFFDGFCGKPYQFNNSEEILMRYGYPRDWKTTLPQADWSDDEKFSWVAGYFAADGTVAKNGQISLSSANIENLICVRDRCREIGIDTYSICSYLRKGYGKEPTPIHTITFMHTDVPSSMILRSKHKRNYDAHIPKSQPRRWSVVSVEPTDRVEEVYCAVVPNSHVFTLNDGILTHNCQYGDFRMKPTDIWTNHPDPQFKPPCHYGDSCHEKAPRGSRNGSQKLKNAVERAKIPELLCRHIVEICTNPSQGGQTRLFE